MEPAGVHEILEAHGAERVAAVDEHRIALGTAADGADVLLGGIGLLQVRLLRSLGPLLTGPSSGCWSPRFGTNSANQTHLSAFNGKILLFFFSFFFFEYIFL